MPTALPIKLSVLRSIGWSEWDPIQLNGSEGGWQRSEAADEYDRYMLRVAAGLQNGAAENSMVDYLLGIEVDHMGLNATPNARTRAEATVVAIREYLGSIK